MVIIEYTIHGSEAGNYRSNQHKVQKVKKHSISNIKQTLKNYFLQNHKCKTLKCVIIPKC